MATLSSAATDGALGTGNVILQMETGAFSHRVVCFGVDISTAVSGGTAIVIKAAACSTTADNTTNARTIGTCTIPATAVVGDCVVNFPTDNLDVNPGERIIVWLFTKSTTNGAGLVFLHSYPYLSYPVKVGTYSKPVATATGSIKVV